MLVVQRRCSCGKLYWPNQYWLHKDHVAINTQFVTAINKESAINADRGDGRIEDASREVPEPSSGRSPNRRARSDYNAYMREFMKEYRRKKRAKPSIHN